MSTIECRALLFDFDGVLVDSTQLVYRLWGKWSAKHGLDPQHVYKTALGRPAREVIAQLAPQLPALEEARGLEQGEAMDPTGTEPVPGVMELLSSIPASCWAIVTSSSREGLTSKLASVGLPTPECSVTANDVRIGKPDPEGYLKAAELLDTPPADCIVIEDSPAGVEAAHRASMRCIGVLSTHKASELTHATFLIEQLSHMQVQHIVDGTITLVVPTKLQVTSYNTEQQNNSRNLKGFDC